MAVQLKQSAGFEVRDEFQEWAHVPSDLVRSGKRTREPLLSIVVATFRRPELLVQSVRSCLDQVTDHPFEIVVVDNDPEAPSLEHLLKELPELQEFDFRYFVHRQNIQMIGNFNRGISLSDGKWITILNDDDLLTPTFVETMLDQLQRSPSISGLGCGKSFFYDDPAHRTGEGGIVNRAVSRIIEESKFMGRKLRRIRPRHFFWGPILLNIVGFVFRKDHAQALGGFYSDDYPNDTFFMVRYADTYDIWQRRFLGALIRVGVNESLRPATLEGILESEHRLRNLLVKGRSVPRWWKRLSPLITVRQSHFFGFSDSQISLKPIEEKYGVTLPKDRPNTYRVLRLVLRGY